MFKLIAVFACMLMGCASVSIQENSVCDSQILSQLPNVPADVILPISSVPPISFSHQLNLSDTLNKINDVASLNSVGVSELSLINNAGDFSWLQQVVVDIQSNQLPQTILSQYSLNNIDQKSNEINLPTKLDSTTLYHYLSSGETTLTITLGLDTVPSSTLQLNNVFCVTASASTNKGL